MEIIMPPMDDEQIEWCVEMLQTTAKYKDIAILFRDKFDWFASRFRSGDILRAFCFSVERSSQQ